MVTFWMTWERPIASSSFGSMLHSTFSQALRARLWQLDRRHCLVRQSLQPLQPGLRAQLGQRIERIAPVEAALAQRQPGGAQHRVAEEQREDREDRNEAHHGSAIH